MTSFWLLEVNKFEDIEQSCDETVGIFSSKEKAKQSLIDKGIQVDWKAVKGYSTEAGNSPEQYEWWLTEWELDKLGL